ncbi:MAG: BtrH N-terminal domain-containing protein [Halanaerobiales bacterium]|nr:BtrH N-terminal domain-containing protein [Halanaerobiales bacterium]
MEIKTILIPEVDFSKLAYLQCESRILETYFKFYGYGHIEELVGKEICFFEYRSPRTNKVGRRCRNFFEEIETDYGVKVIQKEYDQEDIAWEYTLELLNEGIPVTVRCDSFYLPFNSFKYQKSHSWHYLIINGYSDKNNTVTIYDGNFRLYNKEIPLEIIRDARRSKCNGFPVKNASIEIYLPHQIEGLSLDIFMDSMMTNIENALSPKPENIYKDNSYISADFVNYENKMIGVKGIRQLADRLDTFVDIEDKSEKVYKLFYNFSDLVEQTQLHSEYIKLIGEKFNIGEIQKMVDDLDYNVQSWLVARNIFLKGLIKSPNDMIERCKKKLRVIADLEEEYFLKMHKIIEIINK